VAFQAAQLLARGAVPQMQREVGSSRQMTVPKADSPAAQDTALIETESGSPGRFRRSLKPPHLRDRRRTEPDFDNLLAAALQRELIGGQRQAIRAVGQLQLVFARLERDRSAAFFVNDLDQFAILLD